MSFRRSLWIAVLATLLAPHAFAQENGASRLIAIDVVLVPDATMIDSAKKVNARLRRNEPEGFALNSAHAPVITLVQRFIRVRALDDVIAAVTKATRSSPDLPIDLTATALSSDTWAGRRVVAILVERSTALSQLARKVSDAVQPYAIRDGYAKAFVQPDTGKIDDETIKYVERFVPESSGQKYKPHVVVGIARRDVAKALEIAPFDKFRFKGVKIAIYQVGNFGVAQKQLWPAIPKVEKEK